MQRDRKHLDQTSLLYTIRQEFKKLKETTKQKSKYSLSDCLMSIAAIFGLKYPSLLQMETDLKEGAPLAHNIKNLYQIDNIPSDTHLRVRVDNLEYKELQQALNALIVPLQRGKILPQYLFMDEYYLLSIDGTGNFSSDTIHCRNCCVKNSQPQCAIKVIFTDTDTIYNHHLLKWKCTNKKKDSILFLYSPKDAKWHMHIYDSVLDKVSQENIPIAITNELHSVLSTIKSNQVSKEAIHEIETLLMDDTTLFNGREKAGKKTYYHQTLSAVLVHPDKKIVFPFAVEPIIKQDGVTKNDCERNAVFRLLRTLRNSHPHMKFVIVLDALYANGPLIKLLNELDFRYIITAKNMPYLLEEYNNNGNKQTIQRVKHENATTITADYEFSLDLPLNGTHKDIKVNYLDYKETSVSYSKKQDKPVEKTYHSSWITDLPVEKKIAHKIMKGARSRWKIENEVHNTLKNQGYNFEHNYGHGNNNLSTVFCYMAFIMFTIDQIQEYCGYYFGKVLQILKRKSYIWEKLRAQFMLFKFDTWDDLLLNMLKGFNSFINTT